MKLRIAIAEDNHFLAKAIKEKLSFFEDITVKFLAKNGAELIGKLAEDHLVDVILMDIQMPEMDGLEATKAIRRAGISIPIVGLSANVFEQDKQKALNAGMNDYLHKPIVFEHLTQSMNRWLTNNRSALNN